MDKQELKIIALREALREKVSELTDKYEDRIADLRIEITELTNQNQQLRDAMIELQGQLSQESYKSETVVGEIVEDDFVSEETQDHSDKH